MKLTDLAARFATNTAELPDAIGAVALKFLCPCGCKVELVIPFENPLGATVPKWAAGAKSRWTRTGTTIETLTLSPSIDTGCWHGWVQNGEVKSC